MQQNNDVIKAQLIGVPDSVGLLSYISPDPRQVSLTRYWCGIHRHIISFNQKRLAVALASRPTINTNGPLRKDGNENDVSSIYFNAERVVLIVPSRRVQQKKKRSNPRSPAPRGRFALYCCCCCCGLGKNVKRLPEEHPPSYTRPEYTPIDKGCAPPELLLRLPRLSCEHWLLS